MHDYSFHSEKIVLKWISSSIREEISIDLGIIAGPWAGRPPTTNETDSY